ncbi:RidA family protein [Bradyrhizobium sp. dw_411]|uniref:RidA family protein n=1 Tax=Bradyrhizobium sp. dw_411 TaxID=2720082 RepID=UPI001BCBE0BE|nr:RidA family protein [Bradyrhizobium sp. dw_411]
MTKHRAVTSNNPKPLAHYTEATVAGGLTFLAGQLASDFKNGVPKEARKDPNFPFYGSDIKLQTRFILNNIKNTLQAAGSSFEHVVKAQVFLTDLNDFAAFDEVWREFFAVPPPRTTVGTSGLLVKDTLIEIDLISALPESGGLIAISSANPKPLAAYTEATRAGDLVFAAGQLASDFKTGVPKEARKDPNFPFYGSDIKLQTRFVMEHLKATFAAAGTTLDHVVKAQVFLTDLDNFAAFDEVWREYFKVPPPRTTVGVTGLLIKDSLIEIDLIAYVPGGTTRHEVVADTGNPRPLANYSEAVTVGDFIFAAGQLATDFKTGVPKEARKDPNFPFYGSDIKLQTKYIMESLKRTLAAAGSSLEQVIKAQVFLMDLNDFAGFDEVWREYFAVPPPRTTIGTTGLLIKDALIEIDVIGVR